MSTDTLHDKIRSEVERRLSIARAATPGPWTNQGIGDYGWAVHFEGGQPRGIETEDNKQGRDDADFIALHDPDDAQRRYEYALKVLSVHQWRAPGVNCGCDKGMCSCGEHVPWPCDELIWLAESLGIYTGGQP